jgi:hypothetical protein
VDNAEMLFGLNEYSSAASAHMFDAVKHLTRARSPLLAGIRSVPTEAIPVSRITDADGGELELVPTPVVITLGIDIVPVTTGDLGGVYAAFDAAAAQQQEAMEKMVIASMSAVTDLTGNKIDVAGRPWSWDHITDAMERLPPGDDGEMGVGLILHPDTWARWQQMPPPTPAQVARHAAMLERKREEWKAQKRERRLR